MSNTYVCSACKCKFEKDWSDDEALKEKDKNFKNIAIEDCDIVCDDCYKKIMLRINN